MALGRECVSRRAVAGGQPRRHIGPRARHRAAALRLLCRPRRRRVFDRRHRGRRGTVAVCEPVRGAWAGDRLPRPVNQRLSRIECVRGVPPRLWPARSDRDSYHADCRERRARGARSGTNPVPRRQRDAGAARRRDGGDLGRESRTEPIATRAGGAAWSSLWQARGIGVVPEHARQAGLRIAAPEQHELVLWRLSGGASRRVSR